MTTIVLEKRGEVLVPADADGREVIANWKTGQGVRAEVHRIRNVAHHRKFFALVRVVAEYSNTYDNTEKALVAIKIATGHVNWQPNPLTGELLPIPKSISFGSMDQDAFNAFYSRAIDAVLQNLLPTMTRGSLERAVEDVASFA